jgi:hypothetical protein
LVDHYPDRFRYRYEMGTSFAVAHVSGCAALVWSLHPEWSATEVRRALLATARDLGPVGTDPGYGHGFVDLTRALAFAGEDSQDAQDDQVDRDEEVITATPSTDPHPVHDIAIEEAIAPEVPLGKHGSIPVIVTNRGVSPERVTVTLTDATAGRTLDSQPVELSPGETRSLSFGWQATLPIGTHRFEVVATLAGVTDERQGDNARTFEAKVMRGEASLSLATNKPSYRRSERLSVSLGLMARDFQLSAGVPLSGIPVRVTLLGPTGAAHYNGIVKTNAQGRAVLVLSLFSARYPAGQYLVQAEATADHYEVAAATTTFELRR